MELGSIFIGVALALVSLMVILNPLKKTKKKMISPAQRVIPPEKEHQEILKSLRALEFDYELGQVSEADYTNLRYRLFTAAGSLLKTMEKGQEDILENMIEERRQTKQLAANVLLCHECGHPNSESDRFCANCGSLREKRCQSCGKTANKGHHFCANCGEKFTEMS